MDGELIFYLPHCGIEILEEKVINWKSQFQDWLKEICSWAAIEDYVHVLADSNPPMVYEIRVYTHEHYYTIRASENYLGCQASSRKPRAGEDWTRGNDLPDGKFSRETWDRIKDAIIRYELVKIAKAAREVPDELDKTLEL